MLNLKTTTLSIAVLLLAGSAMAPPTQAAATIQACTPPNPDAWVNACVTLTPTSTTAHYYTYNSNYDETRVCVINNVCVWVPVLLTLIKPWQYTVDYYRPSASYSSNPGQVVEDVCDVIGIVCNLVEAIQLSSAAVPAFGALEDLAPSATDSALPDGMTLEGYTLDENGDLAGAVVSLPGGELVVLPIAA